MNYGENRPEEFCSRKEKLLPAVQISSVQGTVSPFFLFQQNTTWHLLRMDFADGNTHWKDSRGLRLPSEWVYTDDWEH